MTDRINTTGYVHPQEKNLLNLHKALTYDSDGQPVLRVFNVAELGDGTLTAAGGGGGGPSANVNILSFPADFVDGTGTDKLNVNVSGITFPSTLAVTQSGFWNLSGETTYNITSNSSDIKNITSTYFSDYNNVVDDERVGLDVNVLDGTISLSTTTLAALGTSSLKGIEAGTSNTVNITAKDTTIDSDTRTGIDVNIISNETTTSSGSAINVVAGEIYEEILGVSIDLSGPARRTVGSSPIPVIGLDNVTEDDFSDQTMIPNGAPGSYIIISRDETTTGATEIEITGIDILGDKIPVTIALDPSGVTTSTNTENLIRFLSVKVTATGSHGNNMGRISINNGTNEYLSIEADGDEGSSDNHFAGRGSSQWARYTVPLNHTAYLTQWNVSTGAHDQTTTVSIVSCSNSTNGTSISSTTPERTVDMVMVGSHAYTKDYKNPIVFTGLDDIEVRAYSPAGTGAPITTSFCLTVIPD